MWEANLNASARDSARSTHFWWIDKGGRGELAFGLGDLHVELPALCGEPVDLV
jgi:hypothetical protein